MPRVVNQQSIGPGTAPIAFCRNPRRSANSAFSPTIAMPPTTDGMTSAARLSGRVIATNAPNNAGSYSDPTNDAYTNATVQARTPAAFTQLAQTANNAILGSIKQLPGGLNPSPLTPRALMVWLARTAPVVTEGMRPCTLLKLWARLMK